ncbi:MAG TPA: transcriptional regulator, partial [Rikenellaceae bacterium]|nr:transcriptional regulator [Rikenellaceae bacterium]
TAKYCVGDKVRVTAGIYEGLEGYIKRIKHARKFIVSIEGVAVVALTGIHPQYLEKIE